MKKREKIIEISALIDTRWVPITQAQMKTLEPGTNVAITRETEGGRATLYTVYRPPRRRDESPVAYYRRTKVVDDNFARKHNGWYYCNPAHCKHRWRNKANRDEHLKSAYAILD